MEVVDVDHCSIGERPHLHGCIFLTLGDGQGALESRDGTVVVGLVEADELYEVGEQPTRIIRIGRDQWKRLSAQVSRRSEVAGAGGRRTEAAGDGAGR